MASAKNLLLTRDAYLGPRNDATPGFTNFTFNTSTYWCAVAIFTAEATITCTHVGFRYGARVGTPPTFSIGIEGLDSSGNPDGTPISTVGSFTPPADATWDGTFQWVALGASASLTRGTRYAIVIRYSSGTINGSNYSTITYRLAFGSGGYSKHPHSRYNNGSTTISDWPPVYGYKDGSNVYGRPMSAISSTGFDNGSNPDERGMLFSLPSTFCSSYKLRGFSFSLQRHANDAAGTMQGVLYTGTTAIATCGPFDNDSWSNPGNDSGTYMFIFADATLPTLTAGDDYRVAIYYNSNVNPIYMYNFDVGAAADMEPYGGGTSWYYTARNNSGAWSDTTTKSLVMQLLLEDVTFTGGGSGLARIIGG